MVDQETVAREDDGTSHFRSIGEALEQGAKHGPTLRRPNGGSQEKSMG
jgi:hypothetical protein